MLSCGPGDGVSGGAESCAGLRMSQDVPMNFWQCMELAIVKYLGMDNYLKIFVEYFGR